MKQIFAVLILSIGIPPAMLASSDTAPTIVSAYLVSKGEGHTIVLGRTLQFIAYATYSDGSVGALPDAYGNKVTLWNTSNHAVAKISSLGHATALGIGTVNIEGTIGTLKATPWTVTVSASLPLITCSANPSVIYQGGTSIITASGSSTLDLPLTYSYSASGGSISGTGTTKTLNTNGAPAGLITVTCTVDQQGGGSASATAEVLLDSNSDAPDITVTYPVNGSTVPFPAWLRASSGGCYGQPPVSLAYSVDNGSLLTSGITPSEIDAPDRTITPGTHTIYLKTSTGGGDCPAVETTFTVTGAAGAGGMIPSNATSSGDLDDASNWKWHHDSGTPGDSKGSSLYPTSNLSLDDRAREFYVTYTDDGGELSSVDFANDTTSTHFVYDTYIYLTDPSQVQNIEMDMNQVLADGKTVILATQCSANSGTWEWSTITGKGGAQWRPSNIACCPKTWTANAWHHVQIATHRDSAGIVTHDWVALDGALSSFQNATGPSAPNLGWGTGELILNFQLDGAGSSGSITAYIDQMTVYRW
jgi:hypothetical protein